MMNVRAVALDFGGTLAHPGPDPDGHVVADAVRTLPGTDLPAGFPSAFDEVHRAVRKADRVRAEHTAFSREIAVAAAACSATVPDLDAAVDAVFTSILDAEVDDLAADGLRAVHALGLRCVLACDTQRPARVRRRTLEQAGIGDLFAALVLSSDLGVRKPNPAFYAAVLDACGCPADQVLFVGDTPAKDAVGPHEAGMRAVLIAPHGRPEGLDPAIGDLRHLAELPAYLTDFPEEPRGN